MSGVDSIEHYDLVVTIVRRGFADQAMDAARSAGATGGTILHARGAGIHQSETFFGIAIQPEKEVVLIMVAREHKAEIMRAICKEAGLSTPGHGMVFSLPVEDVVGIVPATKPS